MFQLTIRVRQLLIQTINKSDWVSAICHCPDADAKRWVLYACAKVVLPFWESRFQRDDSMANLVNCMAIGAINPSTENDVKLKAAIPKRLRKHWDLSPPSGFFEEHHSICPADFAGDSIYYAACATINDPIDYSDDFSAFDNAKECLARIYFERDEQCDDSTNYLSRADIYLRSKILEMLEVDVEVFL